MLDSQGRGVSSIPIYSYLYFIFLCSYVFIVISKFFSSFYGRSENEKKIVSIFVIRDRDIVAQVYSHISFNIAYWLSGLVMSLAFSLRGNDIWELKCILN